MKTRFAPSPTGYLHIGNIRTALLCFLYARKENGQFILRIDDTDEERSKEEYAQALQEDLAWLGMQPDQVYRQSERLSLYAQAVETLKKEGRLYPCFETAEELEMKRKLQLGRGQPPIYDRAALALTEADIQTKLASGQTPHWRFKLNNSTIAWQDEVRGAVKFEAGHMSDPILIRENGAYTYMLPSTVDDIEMQISHVLRGEDHVSNTAIQIQLFEALGATPPTFAHNALIQSKEGKLSKRKGAAKVRELREMNIAPLAVSSFLATLGSSNPVDLAASIDDLISQFNISHFSRSATQYSLEELMRLNTKWLHQADFNSIKPMLPVEQHSIDEDFWLAVRPNITALCELSDWWTICKEAITPDIDPEDRDFLISAEALLPTTLNDQTWQTWTSALKEQSGRKGKPLFMPLRRAMTGQDHGPELADMLPLIGRERITQRLLGNRA